jgi:hypothetical protein
VEVKELFISLIDQIVVKDTQFHDSSFTALSLKTKVFCESISETLAYSPPNFQSQIQEDL